MQDTLLESRSSTSAPRLIAATIREHADRIFDAHIKNFPKGEKNGGSIQLPRGKIDLVPVFKAFADVGYTGVCSLEYEKDFEDNERAVIECRAYERGVCDVLATCMRCTCGCAKK